MNKLDKTGIIINWTVFAYLSGITILSLLGKVRYGHGFGDFIYLIVSALIALIHLIILITRIHAKDRASKVGSGLVVGMMFLLIALTLTYKLTFGRGPESPWEGTVFLE